MIKTMKRRRSQDNKPAAAAEAEAEADILSLPKELVVEILANVAKSSFKDLYHAKLSCRMFKDLAEDGYIYRHVSLDSVCISPWHREKQQEISFLEKCIHHGNPEALFKQGMREYIHHSKFQIAIKYLERAVSAGHEVASYVLGILYMRMGSEYTEKQGMQLLKKILESNKDEECRKKIKDILYGTWRHKYSILLEKPIHFKSKPGWSNGWEWCRMVEG